MEMDIGSRLREARESKGLSLEEVQENTKIQKRYLQAIENNEFKVLPGKFYTRAFIREYAAAVGLDPEQVMEEHKGELPTYEDEEAIQYSRVQKTRKETTAKASGGSRVFPSLLTLLVIVGTLFMVWFFLLNNDSSENGKAQDTSESSDEVFVPADSEDDSSEEGQKEEEDAPSDGASDEDQSAEKEQDQAEEKPEVEMNLVEEGSGGFPEHVFEVSGVKEGTLTIELTGTSYLEVHAPKNGENLIQPIEYTIDKSPITVELSGKEQLYIKTGNAPGTTVKVNDQEVEFPNKELSTQKLLLNFKE
ncbi:helix-turn-helix domain-containing protein [Halobacillus mangrovi]|nr:RodZ domain-containing protein [Halobacillus mangrovi]